MCPPIHLERRRIADTSAMTIIANTDILSRSIIIIQVAGHITTASMTHGLATPGTGLWDGDHTCCIRTPRGTHTVHTMGIIIMVDITTVDGRMEHSLMESGECQTDLALSARRVEMICEDIVRVYR